MQDSIKLMVDAYFDGVYTGDAASLARLFDANAQVFGEIDGQPYHKPIAAYLDGVAQRKSPMALGEPFRMKLLEADMLGHIAQVKLHSPMLGFNYYLYLTLRQLDGQWLIVNKTFTHRAMA